MSNATTMTIRAPPEATVLRKPSNKLAVMPVINQTKIGINEVNL